MATINGGDLETHPTLTMISVKINKSTTFQVREGKAQALPIFTVPIGVVPGEEWSYVSRLRTSCDQRARRIQQKWNFLRHQNQQKPVKAVKKMSIG